jgi:hypothetical protein
MKIVKTGLRHLLIILPLMLPWASAQAVETFEVAGIISEISYSSFIVRDQEYRIGSTARLDSSDARRSRFADFRKGDQIWFKGIILSGVYYVEVIMYETPEPS